MNTFLRSLFVRIGAVLRRCTAGLAARFGRAVRSLAARMRRIGQDKYLHFAVGAVVAAVGVVLPLALGLAAWFALGYSAFAVWCLAAVEEYAIDYAPSRGDVLATMLGGTAVWGVAAVLILLIP